MKPPRRPRAFTIIELLVVVAVIGLLVGMLLPAIARARDRGRETVSQSNLRNLATAHANYASEWQDRQFTLVLDNIAAYALPPNPGPPGPMAAGITYARQKADPNPPGDTDYPPSILLGWARSPVSGQYGLFDFPFRPAFPSNWEVMAPFVFNTSSAQAGFGWFRIPNARQFTTYLSTRFYDPVFYAPKDGVVMDFIADALQSPEEYVPPGDPASGYLISRPAWSSYCLSPAALFSPQVLRSEAEGGFQDPWTLHAGLRTPAMSQAQYPTLKTHMIEHGWFQRSRTPCNPNMTGSYDGCEPWYFNHGWDSTPITLFYDGHIEPVGVRETERADLRVRAQTGSTNTGLWSSDTPFGETGYFQEFAYDQANTSFHILTTDGIRGRDVISN